MRTYKTDLMLKFHQTFYKAYALIFFLLASTHLLSAQNTPLTNPSNCALGIAIPDSSCNSNNRFPILVTNANGNALGTDIVLKEVRLIIAHTWVADLEIALFSPTGTRVPILTDRGADNDNLGNPLNGSCGEYISFTSDACIDFQTDSLPPYIGDYRPEGNFLDFNDGSSPNGQWTLEICDDAGDDAGTLEFVELVFASESCFAPTQVEVVSVDSTTVALDWVSNGLCVNTIIEYGPVGFSPGNNRTAGNDGATVRTGCPPFQLIGLQPQTTYEIYIREECEADVFSSNACPITVETACLPAAISLEEKFNTQGLCNTLCGRACALEGVWQNSESDDFDWLVTTNGTPSDNTGPSADVEGDGQYIYLETSGSPCRNGNVAVLSSNCLLVETEGSDSCHFSFDYHLFGSAVGSLSLDISVDDGINWERLWIGSGNQGDRWQKQYINLSDYNNQIAQFRFVGEGGGGATGDIGLDNLVFYGTTDLGSPDFTFYADQDEDGFGDPNQFITTCENVLPDGFAVNSLDCDDTNPNIHPNATEITCNGIDENCNGMEDDAFIDPPTAENVTICDDEVAVITATPPPNGFILWFSSPEGTDLLEFDDGDGLTLLAADIQDSTTVYAEAWLGFECNSATRTPVKVKVNTTPAPIVPPIPAVCQGEHINLTNINIIDENEVSESFTFHSDLPATTANQLDTLSLLLSADRQVFAQATSVTGCTATLSIDLTVSNLADVRIAQRDTLVVCANSTQMLEAITTDSLSNYSLLWSTGASDKAIEVTSAATTGTIEFYTLTAFNPTGCTIRDTVWIRTSNGIESARVTPQEVTNCGGNDGSITVEPLGGVAPYTYFWSGSSAGNSSSNENSFQIDNLAQGTYRITVVDSSPLGCQIQLPFTIVNGPNARAEVDSIESVSCFGQEDGSITLDLKGGTPSLMWSNGDTTATIKNLPSGSYSVTITEEDCATIIEDIEVSSPKALQNSALLQRPTCANVQDGSIELNTTGGTSPYTYFWANGGANINTRSKVAGGLYPVQIVDAKNCVLQDTIDLKAPEQLSLEIIEQRDMSCTALSDGRIEVLGIGGTAPYFYQWSNGRYTSRIDDLQGDDYILTITDVNSCNLVDTFSIGEPNPLTLQLDSILDASCSGIADGYLDVSASGGSAPYIFQWSNGRVGATNNNLPEGTYISRVFDSRGCRAIDTFQVQAPPSIALAATIIPPKCLGSTDGQIELIATNANVTQYLWNDGIDAQQRNDLSAGDYLVTLQDDIGCTLDTSFTLEAPQLLEARVTTQMPTCFNSANAAIDLEVLNANGLPLSYSWSNGATTQNLNNLAVDTYVVTITDQDGCTLVPDTIQIEAPERIEILVDQVTDVQCAAEKSGAIEVSITGGLPPYEYSWNTSATTRNLYDIPANTYRLAIVDQNDCAVESQLIEVREPAPLQLNYDIIQNEPCGLNSNQIDSLILTVSGGKPNYRFRWNDGSRSQNLTDITSGNYSVTVADRNRCIASLSSIKVKPPSNGFIVKVERENINCANDKNGSILATVEGGFPPYLYHLSSGTITTIEQDSFRFDDLSPGNYNLSVTDNNGCENILENLIIAEPDPLAIRLEEGGLQNVRCAGEKTGRIDLAITGGARPYDIQWVNQSGDTLATTADLDSVLAGNYTIFVQDANGCTLSPRLFTIQEPRQALEIANLDIENIACFGDSTGQITLNVSGGTLPYSFNWNNGAFHTRNIEGLPAGDYQLQVTDKNNCTLLTDTLQLTQSVQAIGYENLIITDAKCADTDDGAIALDLIGGFPPYRLFWSSPDPGNNYINGDVTTVDGLLKGNYSLNILDSLGCDTNFDFQVGAPAPISIVLELTPTLPAQSTGVAVAAVDGGVPDYDYFWSIPDAPNQDNLTQLSKGNYALTIVDANECLSATSFQIKEDIMDNVEEVIGIDRFELSPNPTARQILIVFELEQRQTAQIKLINMLGQQLYATTLSGREIQLAYDLQHLPTGSYWVQLILENGALVTRQLLKQ